MQVLNTLGSLALAGGALLALWMTCSEPVSHLPRWVRQVYLLLSGGMTAWGVVNYIKAHSRASLSDQTFSVILQARAWLAGFSLAILIVLMLTGVFPRLFGRSKNGEPPLP